MTNKTICLYYLLLMMESDVALIVTALHARTTTGSTHLEMCVTLVPHAKTLRTLLLQHTRYYAHTKVNDIGSIVGEYFVGGIAVEKADLSIPLSTNTQKTSGMSLLITNKLMLS